MYVGACTCNSTPLVKGPAMLENISNAKSNDEKMMKSGRRETRKIKKARQFVYILLQKSVYLYTIFLHLVRILSPNPPMGELIYGGAYQHIYLKR